MTSKEITKFFSGVAGNQVLTHMAMAISGTQFAVFGITYTPSLNAIAAVVWMIVVVFLVYYSWIRE